MRLSSLASVNIVLCIFMCIALNLHGQRAEAASIDCSGGDENNNNARHVPVHSDKEDDDDNPIPFDSVKTEEVPSTTPVSDVKRLFRRVQCTLEKARPFAEELEKDLRRLETTAKQLSETVISRVGGFFGRLFVGRRKSENCHGTSGDVLIADTVQPSVVDNVDRQDTISKAISTTTTTSTSTPPPITAMAETVTSTSAQPAAADPGTTTITPLAKEMVDTVVGGIDLRSGFGDGATPGDNSIEFNEIVPDNRSRYIVENRND